MPTKSLREQRHTKKRAENRHPAMMLVNNRYERRACKSAIWTAPLREGACELARPGRCAGELRSVNQLLIDAVSGAQTKSRRASSKT